tara:strand:+ start:255 stop:515 length:261 start_codon:yes stop_codon:yes gene_type:complete
MKENVESQYIKENMTDAEAEKMGQVDSDLSRLKAEQSNIINNIVSVKTKANSAITKLSTESSKIKSAMEAIEQQSDDIMNGNVDTS